ncbi:MAG: MliC family protein [Minisyncoccota bacterium]
MSKKNYIISFLVLTLFVLTVVIFMYRKQSIKTKPVVVGQSTYQCANNHTMKVVFIEKGPLPVVVPGEPPASNTSVSISIDGAPIISLPQAISADGSRYANSDESLVFWIKGSGAMVLENGKESNYKNCILVKEDVGNLPQVYLDEINHFTLRYPVEYSVDNLYKYNNLGPNLSISGVKFTIPDTVTTGTNLSKDTYVSVEHSNTKICSANDFLSNVNNVKPYVVEDGDFTYSMASSTGAGAGNRYEEYVYAIVDSNPCIAIRYFIHYGVIENYDVGTVVAFDRDFLLSQFDEIRKSITLNTQIVPTSLMINDVYPLYENVIWQNEEEDEFAGINGYSIKSDTLNNITDISAVTMPFEKYYSDILTRNGWKEDISMAAGGPGSAVIAYNKAKEYIVLQYKSEFGVNKKNEPAQCPCSVQLSVFSGSK